MSTTLAGTLGQLYDDDPMPGNGLFSDLLFAATESSRRCRAIFGAH